MQKQQGKPIKALLCQILPQLKKKQANIEKINVSLQNYSASDKLDIIIFPEMSFTGYCFENKEDAQPLAIQYGKGIQFQFASQLAKRLKSYVAFGYIEKTQKCLYNSAAVIDRQGKPILNYHKSFLYFCDSLWCQQGQGFKCIELINTKGDKIKCAIGICMDINQKNFTSGQYQLADYILKQKAQVLLFLTNWTDNEPQRTNDEAIIPMYNYWLHRLRPILAAKHPFLFLAADRVGKQYSFFDKKQISYFGASCAIMLKPGKNYIIKNLGKVKEGYLLIQTTI